VAIVTNRLLSDGARVNWLNESVTVSGRVSAAGTVYVPAAPEVVEKVSQWASELGVDVHGVPAAPRVPLLELNRVRVALWDQYGGSIPSGWTRWLFEQLEFPFKVVYPQELDAGGLRKQYDVLVFVTDAILEADQAGGGFEIFGDAPSYIPPGYRSRLGSVAVKETVPQLLRFLEEGGAGRLLRQQPGLPAGAGCGRQGGEARGLVRLPSALEERSGSAWGQQRRQSGVAMAEAKVGNGNLFLFGPEIAQHGQPHRTFKLLFNGVFRPGATEGRPIS
jgi:hypothetical protein